MEKKSLFCQIQNILKLIFCYLTKITENNFNYFKELRHSVCYKLLGRQGTLETIYLNYLQKFIKNKLYFVLKFNRNKITNER